jgi:hypothetical protein
MTGPSWSAVTPASYAGRVAHHYHCRHGDDGKPHRNRGSQRADDGVRSASGPNGIAPEPREEPAHPAVVEPAVSPRHGGKRAAGSDRSGKPGGTAGARSRPGSRAWDAATRRRRGE